ncbi:hypothetical protein RJ640_013914, partial [Escallonia rubra]
MVFVVGSLVLTGGTVMLVDEYVGKDGGGNFSEFIEGKKYVMVEFYAPWYSHFKAMAPEYTTTATKNHFIAISGRKLHWVKKLHGAHFIPYRQPAFNIHYLLHK